MGLRPDLPTRPAGVPSSPFNVYHGHGWVGYSDWIGRDTARKLDANAPTKYRKIARGAWMSYVEAARLAAVRGITSAREWKEFAAGKLRGHGKCPVNAPTNPQFVYAGQGWVSWGVFLQTGSRQAAKIAAGWLPFERAREFARTLGLSTTYQWRDFVAGRLVIPGVPPANLPSAPELAYAAKGWLSWDDFLASGFLNYEEAKRLVQSLGIRTLREYRTARRGQQLAAILKRVPSDPGGYYAEWNNSYDFFGTQPLWQRATSPTLAGVGANFSEPT